MTRQLYKKEQNLHNKLIWMCAEVRRHPVPERLETLKMYEC